MVRLFGAIVCCGFVAVGLAYVATITAQWVGQQGGDTRRTLAAAAGLGAAAFAAFALAVAVFLVWGVA